MLDTTLLPLQPVAQDLPGHCVGLPLRRVTPRMGLGVGGLVRGIDRAPQRFGECWSFASLDAVKHDLIALDDLISVDP
ncbi:MAG TPA: hypothetical protein VLP43_06725 [Solirubrobacteraceae bacterium]|nr:hypothetical protein [Solirubrobacteraceae bacterium]